MIATIVVCILLIRQCRKPTFAPGRLLAHVMNSTHSGLTKWGLSHVQLEPHSFVLDVGCGGGGTIQQLELLVPEGRVDGIDYSAASVAVARRTNALGINAGHVGIRQGSVSRLEYPNETFDVVTAIETHYYWPTLERDLLEVRRVLRPGGRVVIMAGTYRGRRFGAPDVLAMRLLGGRLLSIEDHRTLLLSVGFTDVRVFENREKGWICAVGVR